MGAMGSGAVSLISRFGGVLFPGVGAGLVPGRRRGGGSRRLPTVPRVVNARAHRRLHGRLALVVAVPGASPGHACSTTHGLDSDLWFQSGS